LEADLSEPLKKKCPIGVFDSGYGGLTILNELRKTLPEYDYLYLGDNARAPYGNRSFDIIYQYTLEAVTHLLNEGCELIILACNTASARALRSIQQNNLNSFGINKRVLGILRPTIEHISKLGSSEVGLLATPGTVKSDSYGLEVNHHCPHITLRQKACPMWVPLVENAEFDTEGGEFFIGKDLQKFTDQYPSIQHLILGCTHYPILKNQILKNLDSSIQIIEQGPIVSESLKEYLKRHPAMEESLSKEKSLKFQTTEDPSLFINRLQSILGYDTQQTQEKVEKVQL
jgi:glutamate racemase